MNGGKVFIIAEAGVNHNGSLETAKTMVDVAAEAGADMVKFQTFSADRLVTTSASKADYQNQTTDASESQHDMIHKLELTHGMHEELIAYCRQCDIEFFSTGFDTQSIDMLAELVIEQFKIPSGEITNLPYLRHIGNYVKPVILSTGMATLEEIEAALEILETSGTPRNLITVLHCNTAYPTSMVDVNLWAMISIREALGVAVGYSDHTLGIEVPIAAVALGATVIEKHFTLDKEMNGPFPEIVERSLRIDDAVDILIFPTCVSPIRIAPDSRSAFSSLRFISGPSTLTLCRTASSFNVSTL